MDKVLPEVVQHCLNAETAEPEALAGCGCRAEPPEMAKARICRQGGAAPRAVHGRVTVTVTRHNSGAGAERPPPRLRRVSWRHVGDELACWRAAGGEPHPRHGRRAKVLSVDQLGELQVCRMEVRRVASHARAQDAVPPRAQRADGRVGAVVAHDRAQREGGRGLARVRLRVRDGLPLPLPLTPNPTPTPNP